MADRDPEVIKQEIAQARDRLALTVDSLAERANPNGWPTMSKRRFWVLKKPAVIAALAGLSTITVVVVVRSIRR